MRRPYGRAEIIPDDYEVLALGYSTPCWIWKWAKSNGYGRVWKAGRLHQAHTIMFQQAGGVIKDGLELDHLCNQRACIRPDHLEPVTHPQNVLRSPRGKIPWETVLAIRNDPRSTYKIAADLGIPPSTVYFIKSARQRKNH